MRNSTHVAVHSTGQRAGGDAAAGSSHSPCALPYSVLISIAHSPHCASATRRSTRPWCSSTCSRGRLSMLTVDGGCATVSRHGGSSPRWISVARTGRFTIGAIRPTAFSLRFSRPTRHSLITTRVVRDRWDNVALSRARCLLTARISWTAAIDGEGGWGVEIFTAGRLRPAPPPRKFSVQNWQFFGKTDFFDENLLLGASEACLAMGKPWVG